MDHAARIFDAAVSAPLRQKLDIISADVAVLPRAEAQNALGAAQVFEQGVVPVADHGPVRRQEGQHLGLGAKDAV